MSLTLLVERGAEAQADAILCPLNQPRASNPALGCWASSLLCLLWTQSSHLDSIFPGKERRESDQVSWSRWGSRNSKALRPLARICWPLTQELVLIPWQQPFLKYHHLIRINPFPMKKENEIDFYSLQTLLNTLEMPNDDSEQIWLWLGHLLEGLLAVWVHLCFSKLKCNTWVLRWFNHTFMALRPYWPYGT